MNVLYSNNVKSKMKDERSLKRYYGRLADKIWLHISSLMVVEHLSDIPNVPPTRRHKLKGRDDCWALDLSGNWRLLIRALDGIEPENITSVEIESVEDYH